MALGQQFIHQWMKNEVQNHTDGPFQAPIFGTTPSLTPESGLLSDEQSIEQQLHTGQYHLDPRISYQTSTAQQKTPTPSKVRYGLKQQRVHANTTPHPHKASSTSLSRQTTLTISKTGLEHSSSVGRVWGKVRDQPKSTRTPNTFGTQHPGSRAHRSTSHTQLQRFQQTAIFQTGQRERHLDITSWIQRPNNKHGFGQQTMHNSRTWYIIGMPIIVEKYTRYSGDRHTHPYTLDITPMTRKPAQTLDYTKIPKHTNGSSKIKGTMHSIKDGHSHTSPHIQHESNLQQMEGFNSTWNKPEEIKSVNHTWTGWSNCMTLPAASLATITSIGTVTLMTTIFKLRRQTTKQKDYTDRLTHDSVRLNHNQSNRDCSTTGPKLHPATQQLNRI
jgi:hypothetical protein